MMEVASQDRWGKRRRISLVFLYVVSLIVGTLEGFVMSARPGQVHPNLSVHTEILAGILFGLGFLWFYTADARLVGRPLIEMARLGIFVGWPVGVPIYLVWARGVRGLGFLLLHGVGLLFARVLAMAVMAYIRYNW